jgi:BirA family biotin operon repressor/biotin-[acetyl-CoA-carboxylase] ligase
VERPDGALEGVAVEVTDDGALVVRDDAGTPHAVVAGDVVHLRDA